MIKREGNRLRVGGLVIIAVALVAVLLPLFVDVGSIVTGKATAQAMELRGQWLGLTLGASDSPASLQLGVPPEAKGVVVLEVSANQDPRGMQAGLVPGDVLVAVGDKQVDTLSALQKLTTRLTPGQNIQLSVVRRGQPLSLVLPQQPLGLTPNQPAVATAALAYPCPYGPGNGLGPGYGAGRGAGYCRNPALPGTAQFPQVANANYGYGYPSSPGAVTPAW